MKPATLAELVLYASSIRPAGDAIVGLEENFTWPEVEERTRKLGQALVGHGVAPGDRVAVIRPKGHESFEAVHAAFRAGAIMVPIDPMAPAAAAKAVAADAGISAVIGHAPTIKRSGIPALDHLDIKVVLSTGNTGALTDPVPMVDINSPMELSHDDDLPHVQPDDPAYLIYTSGSTGVPKGILHTHRSALAYAELAATEHGLTQEDRLAAMTALHFDMSTLELYAVPLAGSAVVQMSEPHLRFPASFTERAATERTTVWYGIPFLLEQILTRGALADRDMSALRSVIYGGEVFPTSALRGLMAALPGVRFENVYGPAEVNACTVHHLPGPPDEGEDVPVGPPCAGVALLIVDDDEQPVPHGEMGALWVSAPTRMRQYWNRPDLTEATRRRRPEGPDWYVTGDLATRDEHGVIWFHGRRDHQVKLRGIRVELEGVESALTDHPEVLQAVAGPWGAEPGTLAATVVLSDGGAVDIRSLQKWSARRLPAVAVPAHLEVLTSLPQTPSGKIDRKSVRARLAATKEPE